MSCCAVCTRCASIPPSDTLAAPLHHLTIDMPLVALTGFYQTRLRTAVTWAWQALTLKIGHGQLVISREASLQLQYAALLQHILPLFSYRPGEGATVDREKGVKVGGKSYEIDVFVRGHSADEGPASIAVEMKCYRVHAASGGKRGATDIFVTVQSSE